MRCHVYISSTCFDSVLQIIFFLHPQLLHVLLAGRVDGCLVVIRCMNLELSWDLWRYAVIINICHASCVQGLYALNLITIAITEYLVLLRDSCELLVHANLLFLQLFVELRLSLLLYEIVHPATKN